MRGGDGDHTMLYRLMSSIAMIVLLLVDWWDHSKSVSLINRQFKYTRETRGWGG